MAKPMKLQISIPRMRWFLLASVLLFIALLGAMWWNHPTIRLIREIEQMGGEVQTEPTGPRWLQDLSEITEIRLLRIFEDVIRISFIRTIIINRTSIDDGSLEILDSEAQNLGELLVLNLRRTSISWTAPLRANNSSQHTHIKLLVANIKRQVFQINSLSQHGSMKRFMSVSCS